MNFQKRGGFTLVELMVAMALCSVLLVLIFPPIVNALNIVTREAAMLEMDTSGHRAVGAVTATLRQAVLPVLTDADDADGSKAMANTLINVGPAKSGASGMVDFHKVVNSPFGFGQNGAQWRAVLEGGSDFLPYAQLVPYIFDDGVSSHDTLDSNFLPQLGVVDASARVFRAAQYTVATGVEAESDDDGLSRKRYLLNDDGVLRTAIHPSLANLQPSFFGFSSDGQAEPLSLEASRFAPELATGDLALPAGGDTAFGVIRFVPVDSSFGGVPDNGILSEARLGWDLNDDGRLDATFALGRLETVYFPDAESDITRKPLTTDVVLLQIDADNANYRPLFRLRQTGAGGFVMDVELLFCDMVTQRKNPLAFGKAVPFLTRRYTSSVEMRNMSRK